MQRNSMKEIPHLRHP